MSRIPELAERIGAKRLITLINPRMVPDTPPAVPLDAHLKLVCSDICEPIDGRVCPQTEHVEELIRFIQAWNHDGPLLIHCLAGVSRSTAAAYIALCTLNEHMCEHNIARRLRQASPSAAPNRLLVGLADEILRRHGRMLQAVNAIGTGRLDGLEGEPFSLPSRLG